MSSESSFDTSGSSTSKTSGSTSSSSSTNLHSKDIVEKSSCTSARHRTKWGHAKCKKLEKGGPRHLTFDKNGIARSPVKHVNEFSSYCGYIAHMRVDIRISGKIKPMGGCVKEICHAKGWNPYPQCEEGRFESYE
jgi:hypothetical protein